MSSEHKKDEGNLKPHRGDEMEAGGEGDKWQVADTLATFSSLLEGQRAARNGRQKRGGLTLLLLNASF